MKKIVIIGAGPAGLTAAYELLSGGEKVDVTLLESGSIPGGISADSELIRKEMLEVISRFLTSLSPDKRKIFVRRYWYADPITKIASATGLSENHIAVTLSRMRKTLHKLLMEGGFDL